MNFDIIGEITDIEIIAVGSALQEIARLRKTYGVGRWRKLKGFATVRFDDGIICEAELQWYEAHGIGKRDIKIKNILEE